MGWGGGGGGGGGVDSPIRGFARDFFFRQSCLSWASAAIAIIDILVNIAKTIAISRPLTHSTKI